MSSMSFVFPESVKNGPTCSKSLTPSSVGLSRKKSDLTAATKHLREKHQKILNFGKKKKRILEDNVSVYSFKSMDDVKELLSECSDSMDRASQTSDPHVIRIRRHRSNCQLKFHKEMMSLPFMQRQLSSPVLPADGFEDDNKVQTMPSNLRNNRFSWNSMGSGASCSSLNELLSDSILEKKQDEAAMIAEKERLQRIMLMTANFSQEAMALDKLNTYANSFSSAPRGRTTFHSRGLDSEQYEEMSTFPDHVTKSGVALIRRQSSDFQRQMLEEETKAVSPRMNNILRKLHLYQSRKTLVKDIEEVITEIETQLSLCMKELEIDRALAEVKLKAERRCLNDEDKRCEQFKEKILHLEEEYMAKREQHQEEFENENLKLDELRSVIEETRSQIDKTSESMKEVMEEKLKMAEETLEQEVKKHEDAEFNMLETISNLDEEKEEMQKSLILQKKNLVLKINNRRNRVDVLQSQLNDLIAKQKFENQRLNKERDSAIELLQEVAKQRNGFSSSFSPQPRGDLGIQFLPSRNASPPRPSKSDKQKLVFIDDFINSININDNKNDDVFLRRNGFNEPKEISHDYPPLQNNFHATSHLADQRSNRLEERSKNYLLPAPSHSTPSYEKLQPPAPTSARSNYERVGIRRLENSGEATRRRTLADRRSACSVDSIDSILASSAEYERLMEMKRQLAEAKAKKEMLLNSMNLASTQHNEDSQEQIDTSIPSILIEEKEESPPEEKIQVVMRNKSRHQARPSSRFLPVRSSNFDLREHIEVCGHNPSSCRQVIVTATSCRGQLSKKCSKINLWRKRWFVFDRTSKYFIYYKNKREVKEKGKICFESIEDVFFDHLKSQKSLNPSLTFCVKCYNKVHYFTAPSSEAMRIWMDVIVTGAEGYREYMKTLEK